MSPTATALVITGPTGSGKSDLALQLAGWLGGDIVNSDSLQLYRYMDVGTAKTPVWQRQGIRHHLVDILDPDEVFTAGQYQRLGRATLAEVAAAQRVPIVVGGTGLYIRALLDGLFVGPERDDRLRDRLSRRKPGSLHRLLSRFDPAAAEQIHPNDTKKLIRALEVYLLTRAPITSLYDQGREPLPGFRLIRLGLDPERESLAERINARCMRMFESGLVDEVRHILALGFPRESKALEAIGYRECLLYLEGSLTLDEAVTLTQAATRQYAKRQRTWFRRDPAVTWLKGFGTESQTVEAAKRHVDSVLSS